MSHVSKLPSAFNGPQSPMLASDSPFPSFKSDYRYKGVYERAGFDVNLNRHRGNQSPHDSRHPAQQGQRRKPESPASQTFSFKSANETFPKNQSLRSLPMSARGTNMSPSDSRSSASKTPVPYKPVSPTDHHANPVSAPASAHPANAPDRFQLPRKAPKDQNYPEYQAFQPFKPAADRQVVLDGDGNAHATDDSVSPRSGKNIKNLYVHIPSNNSEQNNFPKPEADFNSNLPTGVGSDSDFNSPTFDNAERVSTAHTSTSSSREFRKNSADSGMSVKTSELVRNTPYPPLDQIPVIQEHQDLSTMLESFRLDVEEHKKYDPRKKVSRTATRLPDNVSLFTPDTTNHSIKIDDCFSSQSSFTFSNDPTENQKPQNGLDYENFLQTSAGGDRKLARNSNLSTISSIISKLNDGDDRDDEVDPELHRQLESLKAGSQVEDSPALRQADSESFVTAQNLPEHANKAPAVPVFNIQDVSEKDECNDASTEPEVPSSNPFFEGREGDDHFEQGSTQHEPLTSVEPQVVANSNKDFEEVEKAENFEEQPDFGAQTTPHNAGCEFDLNQETPETIMPLSPKNHRIEQELKDMNFKYESGIDEFDPVVPPRAVPVVTDDSISQHNRPSTAEFNPFPQSIIGTQYPKFRDSDLPMKTPPGQGKCRGCGEEVEKFAKGSKKAVFSRTGELSGQWHRGCFSCSYTGCDVTFNKHTSCYVLLDNAFCNHHYHLLNGTLCQSCHTGIEGECIENEMRQKWHLDCLKCNTCHTHIKNDYFLINGEVACENDANRLISRMQNEGMLSTDKIEKRRTRMMFVDQVAEF